MPKSRKASRWRKRTQKHPCGCIHCCGHSIEEYQKKKYGSFKQDLDAAA